LGLAVIPDLVDGAKIVSQSATREDSHVLTLEEIGSLAQEGGKPAETLMNVVALIAGRTLRSASPRFERRRQRP
jgi:hypothetical protein